MASINLRAKDKPSNDPSRFLAALQEGYDEVGDTFQEYADKTMENNQLLVDDLNQGPVLNRPIAAATRLATSTGDVIGLFGGLAGNVLGVAGDLAVPDEFGVEAAYQKYIEKPLQEGIMAAADTEIGRAVIKAAEENPRAAKVAGAFGNILSVTPIAKIANGIARNMPTEVRGFYSGNPLIMAAGVLEAAAYGAKDSLASAFNPKALALQSETGITKGLVRQAKKAEALVARRTALASKVDAGDSRAITELEAFDKKHKGYGSMTEGGLAYNYLFRKQMGEDIPEFIQKNFENLNVLESDMGPSRQRFNSMVFEAPRTMATKAPENPAMSPKNQEYLQDRIYNTWGIKDGQRNNTAIIVKDPDKQHSMTDQARMQRSDGTSQFFTNFKDTGIDLKTASPQEVVRAAEGRTLTIPEKDLIRRVNADEKLTQKQRNASVDAIRKLKSEPKLVWNPEQELFTVQDSFKAGAKELGGVNRITTMDRNGNVNVIVSDRHDMMGFDPVDGKPLLTIFPPMQYNIYKGRGKDTYKNKESQLGARRRLSGELGESLDTIKPSYTKDGQIKQGSSKRLGGEVVGEYSAIGVEPTPFPKDPIYGSRSGVARRVNQRIAQEADNFSPTMGQLAGQIPRVATNAALAGNYGLQGAGMLSGQPQEEQ